MGKNKKNWFVRFDNWLQKYLDRLNKREIGLYKASPIGYPLFHSFFMLFFLLFFVSLFVITVWFMSIMIKPVPFEIEGSCNTGFIGIDFQSEFKNYDLNEVIKEYRLIKQFGDEINGYLSGGIDIGYYSTTPETAFVMYKTIFMPKELNLKNIDGLNCNFKVKGAIPLNQLSKVNW